MSRCPCFAYEWHHCKHYWEPQLPSLSKLVCIVSSEAFILHSSCDISDLGVRLISKMHCNAIVREETDSFLMRFKKWDNVVLWAAKYIGQGFSLTLIERHVSEQLGNPLDMRSGCMHIKHGIWLSKRKWDIVKYEHSVMISRSCTVTDTFINWKSCANMHWLSCETYADMSALNCLFTINVWNPLSMVFVYF